MIRINLLPTKEKEQADSRRQELSLLALLLVLELVVFGVVRFSQSARIGALDQEIATEEARLGKLNNQMKEVATLEQKSKDLDAKLKVISDLVQKRVGPVGVMNDLSRATPDRLWITELTETAGSATLIGKAIDNQTIAEFLRALSTSPYFTTVDLVETAQDEASSDIKLRKFIIRTQINYAA
ncbi:MAG: hypothetical protein QOD06_2659, partial [Candidatus Binatota bacterium]|nr:hypothetical protein [Candidatus Binatota bacterium]